MNQSESNKNFECIAIVGIAVRMPGAEDVRQFWENLKTGKECISLFSKDEMLDAGVSAEMIDLPNYVAAKGILEGVELFDANFFGIAPREAELMDPQHRVLMECAWAAMEDAGYVPEQYPGRIAVFTSAGMNTYLPVNLMSNPDLLEQVGGFELSIYNDKDFVPTRIAYSMNIKGPAIDIGTACSSSLVSTHLACQHLLTYQSDMALVGGITIHLPQKVGHLHEAGSAYSPDRHCRPFDSTQSGLIDGNGAAVIIVKRLEDALNDGDKIHALIRGSAINNDGSDKVGYAAPSVNGQAEAILEALAVAEVEADSISYVEAHGTSTPLGDPIELAALTQAYRTSTNRTGYCGVGSVKSNIGHVDKAAGLAGLIKTTLALEHELLPPSLNWEAPNPKLQIEKTPFYVVHKPQAWVRSAQPRRAGISSFGVGGTNAHAILEEAPLAEPSSASRSRQLITLSAKTKHGLADYAKNLTSHLAQNPEVNIADVASTLARGRKAFTQRLAFTCRSAKEAVQVLQAEKYHLSADKNFTNAVFMFPGQGSQYAGMAKELYQDEPTFQETVDACALILQPLLNKDIRTILFPKTDDIAQANLDLQETHITQPCLFTIEYALAKLWIHWGVQPKAMIGHSLGEYVAACVANVLSLEDALKLVANRSQLMQDMATGSMLSVPMSAERIRQDIESLKLAVEIAAENSPTLCVVSGPKNSIEEYQSILTKQHAVESQILRTSHAFHSSMMEPMLKSFEKVLSSVTLKTPSTPYVSNLSGTWITQQDATDPQYWCRHLRQAVCFSQGIQTLLTDIDSALLIEVGPGKTLGQLARLNQAQDNTVVPVAYSLPTAHEKTSATDFMLDSLAKTWVKYQPIDWNVFYQAERRFKVSLPTYPFERTRYWIEAGKTQKDTTQTTKVLTARQVDPNKWFYTDSWKSLTLLNTTTEKTSAFLIFCSQSPAVTALQQKLQANGHQVILAYAKAEFTQISSNQFALDFNNHTQLDTLFSTLKKKEQHFDNLVYLDESIQSNLDSTLSFLSIAKALGALQDQKIRTLRFVGQGVTGPFGSAQRLPVKASILGLIASLEYEQTTTRCSLLDVEAVDPSTLQKIYQWLIYDSAQHIVALRANDFWELSLQPLPLDQTPLQPQIESQKTYLVLGGLDGVGQAFAQALAEAVQGKFLLSSRDSDFKNNADVTAFVQRLEKTGSKIFPLHLDPAQTDTLAQSLDAYTHLPSDLDGLICCYDMLDSKPTSLVNELSLMDCQSYLEAQGRFLEQLSQYVDARQLGFCVVMSSLSAKIGGIGQTMHAMAGSYANAFISIRNKQSSHPWMVMNWDRWTDRVDADATHDFSAQEGMNAFRKALDLLPLPSITIATSHPQQRKEQAIHSSVNIDSQQATHELYERPELEAQFIDASTPTELRLAKLWQDCLKIKRIGVHDNFFDLGGHSLLAAQLIRQIKQTFQATVDLGLFFSAPSIYEQSALIDSQIKLGDETSELAIDLDALENMTEQEVEALLASSQSPEELLKLLNK
ncbi:MAG: acyltransferase domain-containing protein [Burkholderiales bacterium]|jgi:phthiocerol/phenolphthiocerol synthesis type-I polyketide synthase E|nr:acyltransferase domain-containing protein [Burkholderiales bacterium]